MIRALSCVAGLVLALSASASAEAADRIAGPVDAEALRVVDGDTIELRASIWLGLDIVVSARIRGIDAPEMRGRCPHEKQLAAAARDRLAELAEGARLRLRNVEHDKYAGRVVADMETEAGLSLAGAMLKTALVRPYDGTARMSWCEVIGMGG